MKEIKDILSAYDRLSREGCRMALATVVKVDGSSYRRPGARMLVTEDGRLTGAISGGCLEGDALRKARLAIYQQKNKIEIYDTTDDDDLHFGVQLGCNGIVHILFEPIDPSSPDNPIELLKALAGTRKDQVLVTLFSDSKTELQPGTSLLYTGEEQRSALNPDIIKMIQKEVVSAFNARESRFLVFGQLEGFIEFVPPAPALVIAGAGNDVIPLTKIAALLGWHITVIDGRPTHATYARFPHADRVFTAKPQEVLSLLQPDTYTLFVLMTHNYNYDLALLKELIPGNYPYIGLLGPRSKLLRMLDDIHEDLIPEALQSLHGPVGLDIGAETPEEIALSIVAEIKAFLSGRKGGSLKNNTSPIHDRIKHPAVE